MLACAASNAASAPRNAAACADSSRDLLSASSLMDCEQIKVRPDNGHPNHAMRKIVKATTSCLPLGSTYLEHRVRFASLDIRSSSSQRGYFGNPFVPEHAALATLLDIAVAELTEPRNVPACKPCQRLVLNDVDSITGIAWCSESYWPLANGARAFWVSGSTTYRNLWSLKQLGDHLRVAVSKPSMRTCQWSPINSDPPT
jgi:hypothetical protein